MNGMQMILIVAFFFLSTLGMQTLYAGDNEQKLSHEATAILNERLIELITAVASYEDSPGFRDGDEAKRHADYTMNLIAEWASDIQTVTDRAKNQVDRSGTIFTLSLPLRQTYYDTWAMKRGSLLAGKLIRNWSARIERDFHDNRVKIFVEGHRRMESENEDMSIEEEQRKERLFEVSPSLEALMFLGGLLRSRSAAPVQEFCVPAPVQEICVPPTTERTD